MRSTSVRKCLQPGILNFSAPKKQLHLYTAFKNQCQFFYLFALPANSPDPDRVYFYKKSRNYTRSGYTLPLFLLYWVGRSNKLRRFSLLLKTNQKSLCRQGQRLAFLFELEIEEWCIFHNEHPTGDCPNPVAKQNPQQIPSPHIGIAHVGQIGNRVFKAA